MMPMGIWSVGDRVTSDFYHGEPATITRLLDDEGHIGGFAYVLDKPHSLGPRHGWIERGEAYVNEGWRHIRGEKK